MKKGKRFLALLLSFTMLITMIPAFTFNVSAASWDIKNGGEVYTGQTATLTCYGGAAYQITNVIFEATSYPTIAKVTGYNSDGEVTYERDVFGGYSYSKTFCYGGDKFIIEVLYGSIEISYNTANTIGPSIVCQENGMGIDYLIKPNMPTMYLEPGETQELFIQDVYPGYEAELRDECFSSDNSNIASVTKEGVVTANREGETQIDILYTLTNAAGNSIQLTEPCDVIIVDDAVNKRTGLRFYYSIEEIEPGDTVQIGADYSYGDFTGMYYPGTVEWRVSNEDVLKIIQTVDNITMVRVEALAMGPCELSLILDGEVKCTETINVTITDDTLISMYKDYLTDCAVMTTLADARNTCWDVVERYSSGNKARIAFMTCLKSDLGLSVITKEAAAAVGLTSSTHDDTVDEAIDLLMAEIFSSEEAVFADGLSTFKKRFKAYGAFTKTASFSGGSVASALSQVTSFSEKQIKSVEGLANGFIGDGITMAELVSGAVMTVQYERDVVVSLMNAVASAPCGTSSDLYKGLERLLFEMDNLELYVATRYLNNEMVDGLKDIIKDGLFYSDAKIFNKTIWNVASGMGYLISRAYAHEGGIFADDYMKACITAGFAGTLCNAVKNSDSASELEYSFKFYVSSVKVALNAAIGICEDAAVNCLDLKYIAEGYLNQIDATCTYENLLEQCRRAVINASDLKSNVYMEDGEIVVDAYWKLPDTKALTLSDLETDDFFTTGYESNQLIVIPSHINGEKVTGIAADGFRGITDKKGIVLPESIIKIGDYAFADCPQVTFVALGDNLKDIGAYAFSNNYALQAINLPSSLENIKEGAFNNCYNLSSVITDASQIGTKVFNNCTSLTSVTIKNKNAVIAADAFDNCSTELTIYGYKNTAAEEIAVAKGYSFVELSETVSTIEIATHATKTEYEVGETLVTDGLTLNVTYMDGTTEVVSDGWIAYGDTSNAGENTVSIYYGEKAVSYSITVNEPEITSVELEYSELTMMFGGDRQLTAQVVPDTAKNVKIAWATSDENVVAIDNNGFIEAIGTGTATITAKILDRDVSATCLVTVVDTKEIDPTNTTTDYITFTARENGYYVFYSEGSGRSITGSILDINGNTLYTHSGTDFRVEGQLHKDKTYTFKTSTNSKNNAFKVIINKSVVAETVNIKDFSGVEISEISAYPNDVKNLYYGFTPVNYISEECTWSSSDTSIAKVDQYGKVTMVAPGTATITLTSKNGLIDTCDVIVNKFTDAPTIGVNEIKQVTLLEQSDRVYYSFTPDEGGWYALYSISDENTSCSLLDSNGLSLTSSSYGAEGSNFRLEYNLIAGETYVYMCDYYYSSTVGTYDIKLEKMNPAETLTIVEGDSFTKYIKETVSLSVEFEPQYCIKESITWTSEDTTVATVNSQGTVTMVGPGETKITATSESGLVDECVIKVLDYPTINVGDQKTVEINEDFKNGYFYFTPEKDGTYIFYSISDSDTYGYLLNSAGSTLTSNDDSGDGSNFRIEYELTADQTYIFRCRYYSSSKMGSFDVCLFELVDAEYVEISNGESLTGYIGSQYTLTAKLLPMISREQTLEWSSSDNSVVAVEQDGSISLLKPGTATITVTTESNLSDSILIIVEDFPTIIVDETKVVEISERNQSLNLKFTPEENGWYTFYSNSSEDVRCYLLDDNGNELTNDDNSGSDKNFRIEYEFEAGKTYIFRCSYVSNNMTGTYDVKLEKAETSIDEVLELDKDYQIYSEMTKSTTFIADSTGFYRITAVQRDKNDYPDIWDNVHIDIVGTDYHAGYSRGYSENGYYVYEDTDVYYFEADKEYSINVTSNGVLPTKLTISKVSDPTSVSLSRSSLSFTEGDYGQSLSVTLSPQYTYGHYLWESSNENVATVDEYGNVKPVGAGEATITLSVVGTSLTATCAVFVEGVEKTELKIGEEYSDLPVGMYYVQPSESGYYTVIFNDCYMDLNDNKYNSIGWLNSSYNMACKYLEAGKTYIFEITSIYNDGAYGSIQACDAPTGISLDKDIKLTPDSLKTLYVSTQNEGAYFDHASATFTIADPEIAEITDRYSRGNITQWNEFYESYFTIKGLKIGQTTLTITTKDGGTYSFPVVIEDYPSISDGSRFEMHLESDENAIYRFIPEENASYTLEATGTQGCSLYVRDENNNYLAGVGENYWGEGHYVSVAYEFEKGKTYYVEIEGDFLYEGEFVFQLNKTVEASEILLSSTTLSGFVGEEYTLSYKLSPTYCFDETVTWQSSDESIVTIDENGNVVFVSEGLATITAISTNGLTSVCTIEVKSIPTIICDEEATVEVNENEPYAYFYFTPDEDGYYVFYSESSNDTYGYVYDSNFNQLNSDDDSGEGSNFRVGYQMNAGTTYILGAKFYSSSTSGSFSVVIEKSKYISTLEITSLPEKTEYIKGFASNNLDYDGLKLKATWSDGTTTNWEMNVDDYYIGDQRVYIYDSTVDEDGVIRISCGGKEVTYTLTLIDNPVDRIELNAAPTREYIYGDTEYGWLYTDGDYEFYPTDLTGLSFTVYYTDGTNKTFTSDDIDSNGDIDGFGYSLLYDEYNPEIGNFPVTFKYMGKSADYTVVLKASTVASIEVTKAPAITSYDDYYNPDFIGMEITITYTDSTTKVVTISEDNLKYEYNPGWGELLYEIDVDGYTLSIEPYYGEDGMSFVAYYLGKSCEIDSITFTDSKEISSFELDKVTWNGDGMQIKITYADETSETLIMEPADYYSWEDSYVEGYGKTSKGLLYYYIETLTNGNGNVEKYDVHILGENIIVEADSVLLGDVNGDGSVNNKDVTLLRRHLIGGWNVTIDTVAADVNNDGSINNKDVTLLRRYLIGGWDVALG